MGYDLRCKLFTYDSKENKCHVISQGWINELKILKGWISELNGENYLFDIKECRFEHDLGDVNVEKDNEYQFSVSFDCVVEYEGNKMSAQEFADKYGTQISQYDYVFEDSYLEILHNLHDEEWKEGKALIGIYKSYSEKKEGSVYDLESFCNASKELEHKMNESIRKIVNFENLMTSLDYFKLTEEQRDSFLETLENEKSLYNEYKDKNEVCNYLIGIMNYFANEEMDEMSEVRDNKVYLFVIAE